MKREPETSAAYGGEGWSPRSRTRREELGDLWGAAGQSSEWEPLRSVLLHRPGRELERIEDPDSWLMLDSPDPGRARRQHEGLEEAYRAAGVETVMVDPPADAHLTPNLMFAADLFFMTPEGAILARPASTARAGEERWVQRRLAILGIPIVGSVGGQGTFEGADAMWLDPETVILAEGARTNRSGADQVAATLDAMGVDTVRVRLPPGTMHLMGQLRIVDRDLSVYWEGRFPEPGPEALESRGYRMIPSPDEKEAREGFALNFVVLGPRQVLMHAGCPLSQALYEEEGIECHPVEVDEITKAAGGIGCLTGILRRD